MKFPLRRMSRIFSAKNLKIIIATSIVWLLLDAILLTYYNSPFESCNGTGKCLLVKPTHRGLGIVNKLVSLTSHFTIIDRPGDMGKPVIVDESEHGLKDVLWKENQFNLLASNRISLNRTLPDYRTSACIRKEYPAGLPATSIIIVFHNEAWTTLLRTIHSILNRTPLNLIEDIILVDDASDRKHLGRQLEDYMSLLSSNIRIERLEKRSGLITARLRGAELAKGRTLTFLDAHCECTIGWLQPLLTEVYKQRSSIVSPLIDTVSDDNFGYYKARSSTWGGFNWRLTFSAPVNPIADTEHYSPLPGAVTQHVPSPDRWYRVAERELQRVNGDLTEPLRSPTIAGGLFTVDRKYFEEIGSYDTGMEIWGAENLELSFRNWQCGGQMLIAPCSRVGHVFRKQTPYNFPGGTNAVINRNTRRLAEVWMDDYKDFLYILSPSMKTVSTGNITARLHKPFKWYMDNVWPESQTNIDRSRIVSLRNPQTRRCIDTLERKEGEHIGASECHGLGGNQVFAITINNELRHDSLCLDAAQYGAIVSLITCHGKGGNQSWKYEDRKALRHGPTGQCLDITGVRTLKLSPCDGSATQMWELTSLLS